MQAYINLFLFLGITQLIYSIFCNINMESVRQRLDNILFFSYSAILCLMVATRLKNVGTDTVSYVYFFHDSNFYYNGEPTDWLFEYLGRFIHAIGDTTEWFIMCTGLLSMIGIIFFVRKNAIHKSTSLLFFTIAGTTFVFFFMYLSAIRQCCSLSFYIVAVCLFFKENRTKKQLCLAIIFFAFSVLIHGSSLFGLPFILIAYYYPITNKKYWYVIILGFYTLSALQISYVNDSLEFIFGILGDNKYDNYVNVNFGAIELQRGRSPWFNMFLLPYTLIACILLYFATKSDLKKWWFQLTLMGVVANNFFSDNLMWGRLLFYLSIFSIVAIPNVMFGKNKKYQIIFYTIFISYFFYKSTGVLIGDVAVSQHFNINTIVPYYSWFFEMF